MKNLFNFGNLGIQEPINDKEKNGMTSKAAMFQTKIRLENKWRKKKVEEVILELPKAGESLHIVSNGSFDYFNIIPRIIDLSIYDYCEEFYFSTWTMSHENVLRIWEEFDAGRIKKVTGLTGEYFRTRESATYTILAMGCEERGQRCYANKNHSKVSLVKCGHDHYVIEGSANFTNNPRIEQFSLTNHQELYNFHKEWMEKLLANGMKSL